MPGSSSFFSPPGSTLFRSPFAPLSTLDVPPLIALVAPPSTLDAPLRTLETPPLTIAPALPTRFVTPLPIAPPSAPAMSPRPLTDPFAFSQTWSATSFMEAPSFEFLPMSVKVGSGIGSVTLRYCTFVPAMSSLSITTCGVSSSAASFFLSFFSSDAASSFFSSDAASSFFSSPLNGLRITSKLLSPASL